MKRVQSAMTLTLNFKLRLTQDIDDKPLVVIFSWLQAKQKHLSKYAQLYMDQDFDVLVAQITPWQLLWPVKGSQVMSIFSFIVIPFLMKFFSSASCSRRCEIHGEQRTVQTNGSSWILCRGIHLGRVSCRDGKGSTTISDSR